MAQIDAYVETIKTATYGKEVRPAIANGLLAVNDNYADAVANVTSAAEAAHDAVAAATAAQEAAESASTATTALATTVTATANEAKTAAATAQTTANTAVTTANNAKTTADTAASTAANAQAAATTAQNAAEGAQSAAETAQTAAQSAAEGAQSAQMAAEEVADSKVSKSGDTMTGRLDVSSGGVVVGSLASGTTLGDNAFAQGTNNVASSLGAHAEGASNVVSGGDSHAEGYSNTVTSDTSHAEGQLNKVLGNASHAEGNSNEISGTCAHAEGGINKASADFGHIEGYGNNVLNFAEHAQGRYNSTTLVDPEDEDASWSTEANAMTIGNGTSSTARSNAFRVNNKGETYGQSAFNSTGADYAEYFEWLDGNPDSEERFGLFVTLDGDKIRLATADDDYILGIVSAAPCIVGNADDNWQSMWLRDEWGRFVTETVEVEAETQIIEHPGEGQTDGNGNTVNIEAWTEEIVIRPAGTETRFVLNPDYDPDQTYIPRDKRPEWSTVGMLGQIKTLHDGTVTANGYCKAGADGIATASDTGYRVLSVDGDIATILFR